MSTAGATTVPRERPWRRPAAGATAPEPALPAPAREPGPADEPWDSGRLTQLRDDVMLEHLLVAAGEGVPDLVVLGFLPRWWDGDGWTACLLLQWRATRWRVVRDDDELVSLPWRARAARRVLRARRTPPDGVALAPALTTGLRVEPLPEAVQLLAPDDSRRLAFLRRQAIRRLAGGPDPTADPRQGVLRFGDDDEAAVPVPRSEAGPVVVVVQQDGDWRACRSPACGGLTLLPRPGAALAGDPTCPSCGRH